MGAFPWPGARHGPGRRTSAGHGLCADLLPELVDIDEWGFPILRADTVGPDLLPHARRAVRACPTLALRLLKTPVSPSLAEQKGEAPVGPDYELPPPSSSHRRHRRRSGE
jgi:ferredoxin